jgi:GT2 family glycosyltransferase
MNLIYICVNYNNSGYTLAAINSLLNHCSSVLAIVVDNNSGNSDLIRLTEFANQNNNVIIIKSSSNIGYFPALNLGIKYLKINEYSYDAVIIGNNDLLFPSNIELSLSRIKGLFNLYPVISPDIVNSDGDHQNPHVINDVSKIRLFLYSVYYSNYYIGMVLKKVNKYLSKYTSRGDEKKHDQPLQISQGHGSCYILSPLFFQEFTSLFAPTMLYGEEFFLQKQLESKGYRVFYEPTINVYHDSHATISNLPSYKHWSLMKTAFHAEISIRKENKINI